ncbi:phosphonate ABC transporter substrate-binding protein [Halotalea alkalilenta]|uniref:Phosphonate ABC transporter substrate-binding protein n=1 Tax=Halotalea alkalilenta TaxID=376489 RepID=A0A172YE21_9GAMM|nr:phosphonate ABC transporter substrate-binding protein [Halotalea alkalilenta]ANF57356.1 phosphonate ABC transporter substrate-binding protein [Halotalea alkalilenta]
MKLAARLRTPLLLLGMGISSVASFQTQAAETINFGIISTESSQNLAQVWQPFLDDMSRELGVEVKPFFATDYAAVIQAMRFNQIDLAWYGNKSAMEAVDRAGGEVFVQTTAANGDPGYWSLMIVNQDAPYQDIDQVLADADKLTFGNGDPNSTSGYLVPGYYVFAQRNVDPSTAFRRTLNTNHETNALSVANGQVDVATFNTEGMERLKQVNPTAAARLREVWRSPLIPSDPLVWRKNLDDEEKEKLRAFFLDYGTTAEQQQILADLQWGRFQPSDDDQLLPIRQLELFRERTQLAARDDGDGEARRARLAEIDAQLEQIEQRIETRSAQAGSTQAPPLAAAQ